MREQIKRRMRVCKIVEFPQSGRDTRGLKARWVGVICTGAEASGHPREPSDDIVGAQLDPERKEKPKGASGGECDKTERNFLQEVRFLR